MTTPLRQKLTEDLQQRGLSGRTQETYIREVQQLAEYYRKSLDQITEAELRAYFLYLLNEKQVASSTLPVALSGTKFFFVYTLPRAWTTFELVRAPKEKKLPIVLTIGGTPDLVVCEDRALPGVLEYDLWLRASAARRDPTGGGGYRQPADGNPCAAREKNKRAGHSPQWALPESDSSVVCRTASR